MPGKREPEPLDRELYEELRNEGVPAEEAARIANAVGAGPSRRGDEGQTDDYGSWTVDELRVRARQLGVAGYSRKRKPELVALLKSQ